MSGGIIHLPFTISVASGSAVGLWVTYLITSKMAGLLVR